MITALSGKPRQISKNLRAGTVILPASNSPSNVTRLISSTSKSVAVIDS
ncbi:Uncharacterised protein [Vibrio cholerae]|nr:Uncharacterised protein [Vibrio cholerae]